MHALEPVPPRSRPRLSWTDAAGTHSVELTETRTAGSAPGCELVIADRAVSRLHAELAPRLDGLWVRDLGSRNGTFVAGVRIAEARVPAGSAIRIGATDLTVVYGPAEPPADVWADVEFGPLLGCSAQMREIFATLAALAQSDGSVLVLGEPGTGKGTIARALHEASAHANAPFVAVDCAALPEPVAAAELLEDALRAAEGGTLLLEEVSELPLALQRELVPPVDAKVFRAVATSTRDLRPLVNHGAFREALYFRLAGTTIVVPPLRERTGDLAFLLERFLGENAELATPRVLEDLGHMPWPNNVRELRLYAERLRESGGQWSLVPGPPKSEAPPPDFEAELTTMEAPILAMLEPDVESGDGAGATPRIPLGLEPWFESGFKEFRERWIELGEREYLRRLMLRTRRSSSVASREAGLERTYLYRLLKKHGV